MIGLIGDIHTMDSNLELALSALSDCEFIAWYVLFVNGHTHRKMVAKFSGKTIINVGSLLHDPCCAKLDSCRRSVQFFDIGDGVFPAESFPY